MTVTMWCSVRGKLERENGTSQLFVSDRLHPTRNSEFPRRKIGGVALHPHFPTGKYQKRTAFPVGNSEFQVG